MREGDFDNDGSSSHSRWSYLQLVAVALQVIEVGAVVVLAVVGAVMSRHLSTSQDRIVDAISSLHQEVQKTELTK